MDTHAGLVCELCPGIAYNNLTGSTTIQDCVCPPGHAWHENACHTCASGTIRPDTDYHSPCVHCASGYYQDGTGQTACKACGANEWSEMPFSSLDSCWCEAGFWLQGLECTLCAHGEYSAGGNTHTQIRPECMACPDNKNTSTTGSYFITECLCTSGHATSLDTASCSACETGH